MQRADWPHFLSVASRGLKYKYTFPPNNNTLITDKSSPGFNCCVVVIREVVVLLRHIGGRILSITILKQGDNIILI